MKQPGDRYQQAADVYQALEHVPAPPAGTSRLRLPALPGPALLKPALFPPPLFTRVLVGVVLLAAAGAIIAMIGARPGEQMTSTTALSNARGYSLLDHGAFDEAVAEFEGVRNRESDDANAWDSLGEGYLASGRAEDSFEAYSRALSVNANFTPSLL